MLSINPHLARNKMENSPHLFFKCLLIDCIGKCSLVYVFSFYFYFFYLVVCNQMSDFSLVTYAGLFQ